jgi:dTDP-4-amino-4,6-dideoxygalactose transaminase
MVTVNRCTDLAVFGGAPAFDEKLHVGRPNMGDRRRLVARLDDILDRRWFTNDGCYVQEFERAIAEVVGVRHCIAMCNGTVALEILLRALGLSGEVILPSFTFVATAHALQWQGITPIFCDIDPHTHTIDPDKARRLITPRTTGIIGVHLWGRACDVEALAALAKEHELRLILDAAHAFACSCKGRMIGSFGDAEVFSFHATKFVNAFEGGAVVTNDDALAAKLRLMKNFGFAGYDKVASIGTNGKMNEVSAAMGLTGLESLDEFINVNYHNYKQYQHELAGILGLRLFSFDETQRCNYQYIVLEIDDAVTLISRDQVNDVLWAENILARRYFYPGCHRMEPYRSRRPHAGLHLRETEALAAKVLVLPTGTAVGAGEISTICDVLRFVVMHGAEIGERLALHAGDMVGVP